MMGQGTVIFTLCYQFSAEHRSKLDVILHARMAAEGMQREGYDVLFREIERDATSPYIMDRIHRTLQESHIVLFDLSEMNANVIYELAYCIGLLHAGAPNKELILLRNNMAPPVERPFDIRGLTIQTYSGAQLGGRTSAFRMFIQDAYLRLKNAK